MFCQNMFLSHENVLFNPVMQNTEKHVQNLRFNQNYFFEFLRKQIPNPKT